MTKLGGVLPMVILSEFRIGRTETTTILTTYPSLDMDRSHASLGPYKW